MKTSAAYVEVFESSDQRQVYACTACAAQLHAADMDICGHAASINEPDQWLDEGVAVPNEQQDLFFQFESYSSRRVNPSATDFFQTNDGFPVSRSWARLHQVRLPCDGFMLAGTDRWLPTPQARSNCNQYVYPQT
jgi:hypothetical protein